MSSIIKINVKKYKEIMWLFIVLYICKILEVIPAEALFIVYTMYLAFLILYSKRIVLPHISGLGFYLSMIIIGIVVGVSVYPLRYVARDVFYVLPTVELAIIGYYLYYAYGKKCSIYKTIIICGIINVMYNISMCLNNLSIINDFQETRNVFNKGIYEICVATYIVFVCIMQQGKFLFKRRYNISIMILFLANIVFSFSRSVWIQVLAGIAVILIIKLLYEKDIKLIKTLFIIVLSLTVIYFVFLHVVPQESLDVYNEKMDNISEEMNSDREFTGVADAMNHWRGFENYSSTTQWKSYDTASMLFGKGLGTRIYVKYIPSSWTDLKEGQYIPILHSAFYTLLVKLGLLGVASLIWFIFSHIINGIIAIYKGYGNRSDMYILIILGVGMFSQSLVVRGPVTQTPVLLWAIMIGWICAKKRRDKLKGEKN